MPKPDKRDKSIALDTHEEKVVQITDTQIYQEVCERERSLLDAATLAFLGSSTTAERAGLALLDRIRRAAEIDIPYSVTQEGFVRTSRTDYTFFMEHLEQTGLWEELAPRLSNWDIDYHEITDPAPIRKFLFGHILQSFPEESRALHDELSRIRSGIHLHFWLDQLPVRERDAYLDGKEAMQKEMHLREDLSHIYVRQ